MPKDLVGNVVKVGDLLLYNGLKLIVRSINEGRILGASSIVGGKTQAMIVNGTIMCECRVDFNPEQLIGVYVLKTPPDFDAFKKEDA